MSFLGLIAWSLYGILDIKDSIEKKVLYEHRKEEARKNKNHIFVDNQGKCYSTRTGEQVYDSYNHELGRRVWCSMKGEQKIIEDPTKKEYEKRQKIIEENKEKMLIRKGVNYICIGFSQYEQQTIYKYKKLDTKQFFYMLDNASKQTHIVKWKDRNGWHIKKLKDTQYEYLERLSKNFFVKEIRLDNDIINS